MCIRRILTVAQEGAAESLASQNAHRVEGVIHRIRCFPPDGVNVARGIECSRMNSQIGQIHAVS